MFQSYCLFRAGFIAQDPTTLPLSVLNSPKLAKNSWLGTLPDDYCTKGIIFRYYSHTDKTVSWEINGKRQYQRQFISEMRTSGPLWMYLHVLSKTGSIQIVDGNLAYNAFTKGNEFLRGVKELDHDNLPLPAGFVSLKLSLTTGYNVQKNKVGQARRFFADINHAYVFMDQPVIARYKMRIEILETMESSGSLTIGITSWDPHVLHGGNLPEEPGLLLDRPEYWMMRENMADGMKRGDYLELNLKVNGDFQVGRNGSEVSTVLHVNNFVPLWIFVNICGATRKIRFLGPYVKSGESFIL